MKKTFLLLLLTTFLMSCSVKKNTPPENLLPDSLFVQVLKDLYLSEGILLSDPGLSRNDSLRRSFKKEIFLHYQIRESDFETTMEWYAAHPKAFQNIYEQLLEELIREKTLMEREKGRQKKNEN